MNIVEIKNEKYSAKINLSRGANCISLRHLKTGAIILREPDYENLDSDYLYGMPLLFPINRIADGRFLFEGRTYEFPINEPAANCHLHGFLHNTEFTPLSQTENQVVCVYRATKQDYPNEFEMKLMYTISENGLTQQLEITNLSEENMPVLLGFHTTFALPFLEGSDASDIYMQTNTHTELERDAHRHLSTGNALPKDGITEALLKGTLNPAAENLSRQYLCSGGAELCLYDAKANMSIRYENSNQYQYALVFNACSKDFICFEPMNCCVNAPNLKKSPQENLFEYIKPGETGVYSSQISLHEGK